MSCPMSLQTLLEGWVSDVPSTVIQGLSLGSANVCRDEAFVAIQGASSHGLDFAEQAVARGASVVLHDGQRAVPELSVPCVEVPELGSRVAALAAMGRIHRCAS